MNAHLQSSLDAVDTALTQLLDSITSYAPSPAAAQSLVVADTALASSLDLLSTHQRNHATLVSLRATSDELDRQLTSALSLLANTRKELLDAPLSVPSALVLRTRDSADNDASADADADADADPPVKGVDYNELLTFAQRISRFTVPPTQQPPLPPPIPQKGAAGANAEGTEEPLASSQDQQLAVPSAQLAPVATPNGVASSPGALPDAGSRAMMGMDIDAGLRAWLLPEAHNKPFYPWPSEDRIRGGALGAIQKMWEVGVDPAGVKEGNAEDVVMKMAEGLGKEVEEGADKAEGEARSRASYSSTGRERARREERAPAASATNVWAELDLYDPDEA